MTSDTLLQALRTGGRKITVQRRAVAAALAEGDGHATAETIWRQARVDLPSLSLRTVYQTLHELEAVGVLQGIDVGRGSTRFDLTTGTHQHVVCDRCGRIEDVWIETPGVGLPPDAAAGFEVASINIVYRGTCPACAAASTDDRHDPGS